MQNLWDFNDLRNGLYIIYIYIEFYKIYKDLIKFKIYYILFINHKSH